jgi:hypothetical protein
VDVVVDVDEKTEPIPILLNYWGLGCRWAEKAFHVQVHVQVHV